jgi:hypothetical protein
MDKIITCDNCGIDNEDAEDGVMQNANIGGYADLCVKCCKRLSRLERQEERKND